MNNLTVTKQSSAVYDILELWEASGPRILGGPRGHLHFVIRILGALKPNNPRPQFISKFKSVWEISKSGDQKSKGYRAVLDYMKVIL